MSGTIITRWLRPGWHIAVCHDCTPILPQPFLVEAERDEWAAIHSGATGHRVDRASGEPEEPQP